GRHRRGGPLPDRRGEARGADDRGGVAQFAESTAAGALAARTRLQGRPIVGWAVRSGAVGRAWARTLLTAHCSLRTAHYASAASYACSAISSRTSLSSRSVPGWSASRWPRTASNRSSSFAACTVLPQSQSITRTVSPYRVGSGPTGGVLPDCQKLARPLRQLRHSEALELGGGPLQRVGGLRDVAVARQPPAEHHAARRVERAADLQPRCAGLLELLRLVSREPGRLEGRGVPDRIVQPVGQLARLLGGLHRLLVLVGEREHLG